MKATELRQRSASELNEDEARLRKELFDASFSHGTRQLTDTSKLKRLRRDIARVMLVQSEKVRAK